jgi:nitrite reductase/ring-hydroxylating ferredoxin subunit
MARSKAIDLKDLPDRQPTLATIGRQEVFLYRKGDEVFAIGNECPHQGGMLCDGWVEGEIVTCPLHGWEFDLRTGACMTVPGESVPRFRVTVEDGAVFVEEEGGG